MKYMCMTILALALALPAAALAGGTPNTNSLANQSCKTQQTAMALITATTFKLAYGTNASRSNAFGKCVAKATATANAAVQNAAKSCKAQQADPNFANATNNPTHMTFDAFYGGNGKAKGAAADANALGKCVSALTQLSTNTQTKTDVSAAKSCKTELTASKTTFASTYGQGRNAFGVCVARHSKI
jgi:hypothetical protein